MLGVILAFFSQSVLQRQISHSSSSQASAEMLAQGAINLTIGDLRSEIVDQANSTPLTLVSSTEKVYQPKAPQNVPPAYSNIGSPAVPSDGSEETDGLANLLKVSGPQSFYPGGTEGRGSAEPTIPQNSTSGTARSITAARWNKPLLFPATSGTDFTPVIDQGLLPKWIYVDRTGGNQKTFSATMKWSPSATDSTVVVGRYAYAIYNEGGILDVNVAGAPIGSTESQKRALGYRGSLALADLTALPGGGMTPAVVNALVGWRNQKSLEASGSFPSYGLANALTSTDSGTDRNRNKYTDFVAANTTGFLTVPDGTAAAAGGGTDHMFVSRQQLIDFLLNGVGGDKTALVRSVQYLGTFSRDLNQPSFFPPDNPPAIKHVMDMAHANGNTFEFYGNDAATKSTNEIAEMNPKFLAVRVKTTFIRADGTPAVPGEPLVKTRFPLSRLTLLTRHAAGSEQIKKYFGLVRNGTTGPWIYQPDGGTTPATSIKRLQSTNASMSVADTSPPREPNFIELLKASITIGSLGKGGAQAEHGRYIPPAFPGVPGSAQQVQDAEDRSVDAQVIQIAANIVDQYDTDDYPTQIQFAPSGKFGTYAGAENLPNLYRVRLMAHVGAGGLRQFYLDPQLWNPVDPRTAPSEDRPSQFRIVAESYDPSEFRLSGNKDTTQTNISGPFTGSAVTFADSATFRNPTWITGFHVADIPKSPDTDASGYKLQSTFGTWVHLECNDGGTWIRYRSALLDMFALYSYANKYPYNVCADPRTSRFGFLETDIDPAADSALNSSEKPATDPARLANQFGNSGSASGAAQGDRAFNFWNGAVAGNRTTDSWSLNLKQSTQPHYADPDTIIRGAMGCYSVSSLTASTPSQVEGGLPMASGGNTDAHPIILNRPFRSVGELGYVFRGTPWKNLDFSTPESGDSALLDVLCLNENRTGSPLVAGVLDLNTRQLPALLTLLSGSVEDELGSTSSTSAPSAAEVQRFAKVLSKRTRGTTATTGPLQNRSELVGRYRGGGTYDGLSFDLAKEFAGTSVGPIRRFLETGVRALSGTTTTRVWNLMIDVVAQSGKFPSAATSLANFQVEGERRYWVHVAIDRYTGKVLDQKVELVSE